MKRGNSLGDGVDDTERRSEVPADHSGHEMLFIRELRVLHLESLLFPLVTENSCLQAVPPTSSTDFMKLMWSSGNF